MVLEEKCGLLRSQSDRNMQYKQRRASSEPEVDRLGFQERDAQTSIWILYTVFSCKEAFLNL